MKKRIIVGIIIAGLSIAGVVGVFLYNNYQEKQEKLAIEKMIKESIDVIEEQKIAFDEAEREKNNQFITCL